MKTVTKYWWLILIKGIILILLSFYVFAHPVEALVGLALYIGIALLFTGFFLIVMSISNRDVDDNWGWRLTEGILDVIFAWILLSNPAITASVFPFVIGFWMIFYGIMMFAGSFGAKKAGDSSWWLNLLIGILTVVAGYIMMTDLFAGSMAITFWIGFGFLLFGMANIFMSLSVRKLNKALN